MVVIDESLFLEEKEKFESHFSGFITKYTVSGPKYHIHVDGKKLSADSDAFQKRIKRELRFSDAPFAAPPGNNEVPIWHMTKKYNNRDKVNADFERVCEIMGEYTLESYIEVEEIFHRFGLPGGSASPLLVEQSPIQIRQRPSGVLETQLFKYGDIHLTVDRTSHSDLLSALDSSHFSKVYPIGTGQDGEIVYTTQFPTIQHSVQDQFAVANQLFPWLVQNANSLGKKGAELKLERIMAYDVSNVSASQLPRLYDGCENCNLSYRCHTIGTQKQSNI